MTSIEERTINDKIDEICVRLSSLEQKVDRIYVTLDTAFNRFGAITKSPFFR